MPTPPAREATLLFLAKPTSPPTMRMRPYGMVKQKSCILFKWGVCFQGKSNWGFSDLVDSADSVLVFGNVSCDWFFYGVWRSDSVGQFWNNCLIFWNRCLCSPTVF